MSSCLPGRGHIHRGEGCRDGPGTYGPGRDGSHDVMSRLRPPAHSAGRGQPEGSLSHWPVQLRLVPENAPYLKGCDLLVAADCSAFACGDFHRRFIEGHVTVIGCPKLDPRESWEKLSRIVAANDIRSITAVRMDVPCCSGIADAALSAARLCGKDIEVKISTVRPDGKVME